MLYDSRGGQMGRPIFLDFDLVTEGMYRSGETVAMSDMRN